MAEQQQLSKVQRISRGTESPKEAVAFMQQQQSQIAPQWDSKAITRLVNGTKTVHERVSLKEQWEVSEHPAIRNKVRGDKGDPNEYITELGLSEQQMFTRRIIDMMFGNPVAIEFAVKGADGKTDDPDKKRVADALTAVLKQNTFDAMNRERFVGYFAGCQMVTVWQSSEKLNRDGVARMFKYGDIISPLKISCRTYSTMNGDTLHPVFDASGDLVLFGIGTRSWVDGVETDYFMIFSEWGMQLFTRNGSEWVADEMRGGDIGKLSLAFIERQKPIWGDTSSLTFDKEWKLTKNGQYIDHNSVPNKVVSVSGDNASDTVLQMQQQYGLVKEKVGSDGIPTGQYEVVPEKERPKRGLSRDVVGENISMQVVEWQGATAALEFHTDALNEAQDRLLGLPDLSPRAIIASGIALETLQMILEVSALRVTSEGGPVVTFIRREINVIKEHLKAAEPKLEQTIDDLDFEVKIVPFQVSNRLVEAQVRSFENGGKAVTSQEASVKERHGEERGTEIFEQLNAEAAIEEQNNNLNDSGLL